MWSTCAQRASVVNSCLGFPTSRRRWQLAQRPWIVRGGSAARGARETCWPPWWQSDTAWPARTPGSLPAAAAGSVSDTPAPSWSSRHAGSARTSAAPAKRHVQQTTAGHVIWSGECPEWWEGGDPDDSCTDLAVADQVNDGSVFRVAWDLGELGLGAAQLSLQAGERVLEGGFLLTQRGYALRQLGVLHQQRLQCVGWRLLLQKHGR